MKWEEAKRVLQLNGVQVSALGYCKIAFDLGQEARPRYDDLMQHLDSLQEKLKTLEAEQVAWRLFTREADNTMDKAYKRIAELESEVAYKERVYANNRPTH